MYAKRGRDEVPAITVENIFGGTGKVIGRQLLGEDPALRGVLPGYPEDFDSTIHFIHETIIDVGALVGTHPHEGSEEVYFFIEGEAEMIIDGEKVYAKPGDAVLTKDGSVHSTRNIGTVPIRIVVVEGGVVEKGEK
jgi:mannose-6-phosphate isomerase-like protein (cupin superfamily)